MSTEATGYLPIDLQVLTAPSFTTIPAQTSLDNRDWELDLATYFNEGFPAQELALGANPPSWASISGTKVSGTLPDITAKTDYTIPIVTGEITEFSLQAIDSGSWAIRGMAVAANLDPPRIYLADRTDNNIYAYDALTYLRLPDYDIAYDPQINRTSALFYTPKYPPETGYLWILNRSAGTRIFRQEIGTGERRVFRYPRSIWERLRGLAVIGDTIYILNDSRPTKRIHVFSQATTPDANGHYQLTQTSTFDLNSAIERVGGLTYFDGLLWVLDRVIPNRKIYAYSPTGTEQTSKHITLPTGTDLGSSSLTNDGKFFYVSHPLGHSMLRVPVVGSASTSVSLAVSEGDAPTIDTIPNQRGSERTRWSLDLSTYLNHGTASTTLTIESGAPSWVSLSGTTLSGTPPNRGSATNYNIPIKLTSTAGSDTATVFLSVPNTLYAPYWWGSTSYTYYHNASVAINLYNRVGGGPSPRISRVSGTLPRGLRLTSGYYISGRPTQVGSFSLTFRASNSQGSSTRTVTITVNRAARWLDTRTATLTYNVGTAVSWNVNNWISGYPIPTVKIQSGGLPAGMTLSNNQISGTPRLGGTHSSMTLRITNTIGSTTYTHDRVFNHNMRLAPTWSTVPTQYLKYGDTIDLNLNSYVNAAPVATIKVQSGTLPRGLRLSSGRITGNFNISSDASVTFRATNSQGSSDTTVSFDYGTAPTWRRWWRVTRNFNVNLYTNLSGDDNSRYNHHILVNSADPTPTVTIVSGTLSGTGMSLSSTGQLEGNPGTRAWTRTVTIRATNTHGTIEQAFTLAAAYGSSPSRRNLPTSWSWSQSSEEGDTIATTPYATGNPSPEYRDPETRGSISWRPSLEQFQLTHDWNSEYVYRDTGEISIVAYNVYGSIKLTCDIGDIT